MNELVEWMRAQLKKISGSKRRQKIFLLSCIVTYLAWFFLLLQPVQIKQKAIMANIQTLTLEKIKIQQQMDKIYQFVKVESFSKAITEHQQLVLKIKNLQQQLANKTPAFMSAAEWVNFKSAIVNQQKNIDSHIILVSLHDYPAVPWAPQGIDKADIMQVIKNNSIYQQGLDLEFQADYFSAMEYLVRLEKLPWPVYWDSLQYKVLVYPKADVIVKLHVFNEQKNV